MIPVEEAQARVLAAVSPLSAEVVGISEALGRVLAEPVPARVDQPRDDVSAMDGYAVRAADVRTVPVSLSVVAEIPAGTRFLGVLSPGECARIFTGAPLPSGADAIIVQEDTDQIGGNQVEIRAVAKPRRHIRPTGLDFRAGATLLPAGRSMTARDVGLAAAMNVPWLRVHRRPRIALLATGDEVVMPGDPLGPTQIAGANSLALAAQVAACGGIAINLGIAADDRDSLRVAAEAAAGADLLVTTGGASVGAHDLVRDVLAEGGAKLNFWRIAMRPGKPLMFGRFGSVPLLGLPGNPVSAQICGLLFLHPVLRRLQGIASPMPAVSVGILGRDLHANDQRCDYLRAGFARDGDGMITATPFDVQDSSMLSALAEADGLVIRPPHAPAAKAGSPATLLPFPSGIMQL